MSETSADRDPFEVVAESFLGNGSAPASGRASRNMPPSTPSRPTRSESCCRAGLVMVEQDLTFDRDIRPRGAVAGLLAPILHRGSGGWATTGSSARSAGAAWAWSTRPSRSAWAGDVALKVLLPRYLAGDGTASERFRREAKAAARLHHTNIVPVFEVGREGEVAYYAMQFIHGQGLDQIVEELRRLREPGRQANGHVPTKSEERNGAVTLVGPPVGGNHEPERACPRPDDGDAPDRQARGRRDRAVSKIGAGDAASGPGGDRTISTPPRASGPRLEAPRLDGSRRPRPGPGPSPSAVLPGGKHVSEVDNIRAIAGRTSGASPRSADRRRRGWPTPTPGGSSTVTSSRRTCCWTPRGSSGSPTSAWPRPTTTA